MLASAHNNKIKLKAIIRLFSRTNSEFFLTIFLRIKIKTNKNRTLKLYANTVISEFEITVLYNNVFIIDTTVSFIKPSLPPKSNAGKFDNLLIGSKRTMKEMVMQMKCILFILKNWSPAKFSES